MILDLRHYAVEKLLPVAGIHLGILSYTGLVACRNMFLTHLCYQRLSAFLRRWHSLTKHMGSTQIS